MSAVVAFRSEFKELFFKKHSVKLGFMSFFTIACCHALQEVPEVNAEIDGTEIIYKNYVNMGVATGTPTGLVVPVIRDAHDMSFNQIEKAISENERLKILIDNIIQASSIENKGLIADKKPININALLEKIVNNSNKRQEDNLVSLNCPHQINLAADVFMIETSIINILENAIKYAGSTNIILNVEKGSDDLKISILDQGPGIDDNEKKFIFDKFYRVGNEETRLKKGSGLGLYIANHFIQLHRGDITYTKNTPCGSIFTIRLPHE